MNLTFDELFSLPKMKDAKLLAGNNSLSRAIVWYHIIEIEEMSNWINSGILVFITGVGLKNIEEGLLNIITILNEKNAAGLVINQGIYIPDVPQSVIDKADELDLPLILLPNKIKLIDVTFQLSHLFQEKQLKSKQRDQILFETLMSTPMTIWDFNTVDGFNARYMYTVCAFSYSSDIETGSESDAQFINQILNKIHTSTNKNIISIDLHGNYIFFIPFEPDTSIDVQMKLIRTLADMLEQNNPYYNNKLSGNATLYGGVGYAVSSFSELKKSYIQAYQTLHIAKCNILKDKILHYNQISLFRMIDINNQDMLRCVVSDCLGSLPEHPELMTTFLTYLDNDRNMNQTAKELFIHVNSVKYRLQQIYNILPIQLNTSYDWLQIQLAAILYKYLLNNK